MPTGNFEPPHAEQVPPAPARVPARYYDPAAPDAGRLFPKWLTFGCGGLALLLLITMVAGSALVTSGGIGELFDLSLSMMQSEASRMFASDVSKEQRTTFLDEVTAMRRMVREGKLSPVKVEPFLQALRAASDDKLLKAEEVTRLTGIARDLQKPATVKP